MTLFLLEHCQNIPSRYPEELSQQKAPFDMAIPAMKHLKGVDLLATIKGEFFYKEEKIKFRALLRISSQGKMRLEVFNPFGKMLSAAIFTKPNISLYIPSQKILYCGLGSADNVLKLLGLRIEAAKVVDILSGIEPFLAMKEQGLFQTVQILEGSSWKAPLSEEELWLLVREGGSLRLKDNSNHSTNAMEILSRYVPDPKYDKCILTVPREDIISIEDRSVILKIQLSEIRSYMLYVEGKLFCGFEESVMALDHEKIFTDRTYKNIPGVEQIDLDRLPLDKPLFIGE